MRDSKRMSRPIYLMDDSYKSKCAFIKWTLFSGQTLTCLFLVYFCSKTTSCFEPSRSDIFVMTPKKETDMDTRANTWPAFVTYWPCSVQQWRKRSLKAMQIPLFQIPNLMKYGASAIWKAPFLNHWFSFSTDIPKKMAIFFALQRFLWKSIQLHIDINP